VEKYVSGFYNWIQSDRQGVELIYHMNIFHVLEYKYATTSPKKNQYATRRRPDN
jgi:hypothetical protein